MDLKDAFHSLRLLENSKRYCGILPYFGSASYLYNRMFMGINISPINLAITYKHDFGLFAKYKILQCNIG